jgi:hypothetical protein
MRKSVFLLAAPLALVLTGPVIAAEPTITEVHAAAAAGHVDQALGMMQQVLKDHPNSAKAHYVEAELYARTHDYANARSELATAERLAPGLPFANAHSTSALRQQLSGSSAAGGTFESRIASQQQQRTSMPWGVIAIVGLAIAALVFLFRKRQHATVYPAPMSGPSAYGNPGYGQPGYGPRGGPWGGAPMGGGGMGSGILGGLATGAAMGAGFAAGEEVVDHLFGGDRERNRFVDRDNTQSGWDSNTNSDMGGDDFGISDDGSWDDGSGGGGDGW